MNGALPPSSRLSRFTVGAHCAISIDPTRVEPVKDSLRTVGFAVSSAPMAAGRPVTMLITPAGIPARSASTPSASAENGVNSDGLITTVQPAASAGPTFRVIIALGKFHGVMIAETPTGSFRTTICRSPAGAGMTAPSIRRASSANHFTKLAP